MARWCTPLVNAEKAEGRHPHPTRPNKAAVHYYGRLSLVPRSMSPSTQTGAYRQRSMPTPAPSHRFHAWPWELAMDGADSHGVTTDPLMARPATISLDEAEQQNFSAFLYTTKT
jgi:hypothetical protein